MRIQELERHGITSINLIGERGGRGKGIIYATINSPLIPINRLEYPEFISKIPRNEGWKLLRRVLEANTWESFKPIIQRLEQSYFRFHTYTIPTKPPIELILLERGSKFIINAVEYGKTNTRLMLYTSFNITQRTLALIIAGNLF